MTDSEKAKLLLADLWCEKHQQDLNLCKQFIISERIKGKDIDENWIKDCIIIWKY